MERLCFTEKLKTLKSLKSPSSGPPSTTARLSPPSASSLLPAADASPVTEEKVKSLKREREEKSKDSWSEFPVFVVEVCHQRER